MKVDNAGSWKKKGRRGWRTENVNVERRTLRMISAFLLMTRFHAKQAMCTTTMDARRDIGGLTENFVSRCRTTDGSIV